MSMLRAFRAARTRRRHPITGIGPAIVAAVLVFAVPAQASITIPAGGSAVPSSGTFLYFNSDPGDYIGGGVEQLYTSADSTISASLPEGRDYFTASVIQGSYAHWWYVSIAAPPGEPLAVGWSYTGAVRAPFRPVGVPGVDIDGDGRGCNTLTGAFDVNELSYAPTGELLVFDATFEQHCEGGSAALFGRIRIENPPPPPDLTAPTLVLPSDQSIEAFDSLGIAVGYPAYATDDRDPNPVTTCSPASSAFFPVGATTVNCSATDASGNTVTGSFQVTVYPPLLMTASLSTSANVNARTGAATISGTLACSRNLDVDVSGQLKQLVANRVYVTGNFWTRVNCRAPVTSWSAEVTADNGRFGSGQATATANAFGCELTCHWAEMNADVKLNARR